MSLNYLAAFFAWLLLRLSASSATSDSTSALPHLTSHIDAGTVLAAINSPSKRIVDSFVNSNDHGEYLMEVDYSIRPDTHSLDDHHEAFIGFTGDGDMNFDLSLLSMTPTALGEGSFFFGSESGTWNSKLEAVCDEACNLRTFFLTDNLSICRGCFEYERTVSALNYNYNPDTRSAANPSFNLGNEGGIVCNECFAYIGTTLVVELKFSGLSVNHFKLTVGGEMNFKYNVKIETPTFPRNYEQSVAKPSDGVAPNEPLVISLCKGPVCFMDASIGAGFEVQISGRGEAVGSVSVSGGFSMSGETGVEYRKATALRPIAMTWIGNKEIASPTHELSIEGFETLGLMVEAKPEIRALLGLTGSHFPFDLITVKGMVEFAPYLGYEANTDIGGAFTLTPISSRMQGGVAAVEAGETLTLRLSYSDYEQAGEVVFVEFRSDCWADDELMPIFSFPANFVGSGSVDMAYSIPYIDFFSILMTEGEDSFFSWRSCDKEEWTATAHLASQPFNSIVSATFKLYVNWHEDGWFSDTTRAMGITSPSKGTVVQVARDFTFRWDSEHFTYFHHELGMDVGTIKTVETVEVKIMYEDCIRFIGFNLFCEEHFTRLTDEAGTSNDGVEALYVDECTASGHMLSEGTNVFAIVSGVENTNVIGRSLPFSVRRPTCSSTDLKSFTITVGESNLRTKAGSNYEFRIEAKTTDGGFTDDNQSTENKLFQGVNLWNEGLPFKDQCKFSCLILEIFINDKISLSEDSSCIFYAGSLHALFETTHSVFTNYPISSADCSFLKDDVENDPMFISIRWDDSFTCSAGQYLDDNLSWLQFLNPDSCETCGSNTYNPTPGASSCIDCPDGRLTGGSSPSDHDSLDDCRGCGAGEYLNEALLWGPDSCKVCGQNEYNSIAGATSCRDCPLHSFTIGSTASFHDSIDDCISCLPGFVFRNGRCDPCPAGSYADKGEQACDWCDTNEFSNLASTICTDCPWRRFTENNGGSAEHAGISSCEQCSAGEYIYDYSFALELLGNKDRCEDCSGEYEFTDAAGMAECRSCKDYSMTANSDHTRCVACPFGWEVGGWSFTFGIPTWYTTPGCKDGNNRRLMIDDKVGNVEEEKEKEDDNQENDKLERRLATENESCDNFFWGLDLSGGLTEVTFNIEVLGNKLYEKVLWKDEDGQFKVPLESGSSDESFYNCSLGSGNGGSGSGNGGAVSSRSPSSSPSHYPTPPTLSTTLAPTVLSVVRQPPRSLRVTLTVNQIVGGLMVDREELIAILISTMINSVFGALSVNILSILLTDSALEVIFEILFPANAQNPSIDTIDKEKVFESVRGIAPVSGEVELNVSDDDEEDFGVSVTDGGGEHVTPAAVSFLLVCGVLGLLV